MLSQPHHGRLHDRVILLFLKEHADDRGTRNRFGDKICALLPKLIGKRITSKSRTVMREDPHDPCGNRLRAACCRAHGKISTLGVTTKVDVAINGRGNALEVVDGSVLRRNARLKRHVEVFLPANKRVVRSAIRHIGPARRKVKDACGELLLGGLVKIVNVVAHDDIPEARACGRERKHSHQALRVP